MKYFIVFDKNSSKFNLRLDRTAEHQLNTRLNLY